MIKGKLMDKKLGAVVLDKTRIEQMRSLWRLSKSASCPARWPDNADGRDALNRLQALFGDK